MELYQYIGIILGIAGIIYTLMRFKKSKMSLGMFLIWSVVWIALIVISLFPTATIYIANLTGIGRGLDIILILGLIGCYYLIFRIYNMIENIEDSITHIVREMALQRENMDIENEDKRKTHSIASITEKE
ncbi:MAG: hypothetical protein PWQ15_1780 [Methanobacterium sp.]|jgi:hypothetical protein|uniref:DUF2304 domain-containing protein n=1 Tax=Methanobacterium sp. TaxID=2164 RepID=UPI0003C976A8|nr:DUF2304 family protein [Methanobacterium sp.]MDI3550677.1 hypothetical protein [Methanobacterium sp.]CDG65036.1 hypothetical protein MBMB1_0934 [Methanobacterium sp. MB1]